MFHIPDRFVNENALKTVVKSLFHNRHAAILSIVGVVALGYFLVRPSIAHAAGVDQETQFVLNTFAFLVWGAFVMWMCAGFTMLESGSVRTKNASMICLKNIGLYSIAGLAFFFIGYNLMYRGRRSAASSVRSSSSTDRRLMRLP